MNIVERINKLEIIPLVKVNLKRKVYDKLECMNSVYALDNFRYAIYEGEKGVGNKPIFNISKVRDLPLGNAYFYLNECKNVLDWDEEMLFGFPYHKEHIRKMYDDLSGRTGKSKKHDDPLRETGEWIQKNWKFYDITTPISYEELSKFSKADFKWLVENFISNGYVIDPLIMEWGKSGLVAFPNDEKNISLMKYRGHALLIKPTKTGVSSIAQRIGRSPETISEKSVEGYADSQGSINYSVLHDCYGLVNFDEFLRMVDYLYEKLFGTLETGQMEVNKSARRIINKGAFKLTLTSNPKTLEKQEEGKIAYQEDYISIFIRLLGKLSTSPESAFSRLGLIVFRNDLKIATLGEDALGDEFYEKVNAIASGILEYCKPQFANVFFESRDWLSKPLPLYSQQIDEIIKESRIGGGVKEAWEGQKSAYRHTRGFALELACIEYIKDLFLKEYVLEDILETAEEKLNDVCLYNIQSFKKIIQLTRDIYSPELFAKTIQEVCGKKWYKPLISCVALLGKDAPDGSAITKSGIMLRFDGIPRDIREKLFGKKYAFPYSIEEKLKNPDLLDELSNKLRMHFEYECLIQSEGNFTIINNQAQSKRIFEALGLEGILTTLQSGGECGEIGESGEKTIVKPIGDEYDGAVNSPDSPNSPFTSGGGMGGGGIVKLQALKPLPKWVGFNQKTYGSFKSGEFFELPEREAQILLKKGLAELVGGDSHA